MKITSRRVAPSVTIGNISDNNGAFWNTGQENDVVRYFPASGYQSSTGKTYNEALTATTGRLRKTIVIIP